MATKEQITKWANEAAAGNTESRAKFVEATIGKLRSIVQRKWSKDRNAQGGVNDVVNSTYKHFLAYCEGDISVIRDGEAMLFGMAKMRVLNRLRALNTEMRDPDREARGDGALDRLASTDPNPETMAIHNDELDRLRLAMTGLPKADQALLLCRESGETWKETAAETGLSVSTLQRRYAELLDVLRTVLDGAP